MPSATPMISEVTMANSASSKVAGTYSFRSLSTGRWDCSEIPRLPWSRPFR